MEHGVRQQSDKYIKEHKKEHDKRKRWYQIVTALAAVAVFCTTYALIIPAITWSRTLICELPEHTHTEACYELTESGERVLTCELAEHTHSDACFDAPPAKDEGYICGKVAHKHSAEQHCYFPDGTLRCTLPEHEHSSACIEQKQPEAKKAEAVEEVKPEGSKKNEAASKVNAPRLLNSDGGSGTNDGTGAKYDLADYPISAVLYVPSKVDEHGNILEYAPLESGTIVSDGDAFQFMLDWTLPDGVKYSPDDTFTYKIPDTLLALSDVKDGVIYSEDRTTVLGNYTATDGDTITVHYTNEEFMKTLEKRYTSLVFDGKFDVDKIENPDVGEYHIDIPAIPGYTVFIRTHNGLQIEKNGQKRIVDDGVHDREVWVDYTVKVTSLIDNTNVNLTDNFTYNTGVLDTKAEIENWQVYLNNSEYSADSAKALGDYLSGTVANDTTEILDITIPEMKKGDVLTVTYSIKSPLTGQSDAIFDNTAQAESDQSHPVDDNFETTVKRVYLYKKGTLSERVVLSGDGKEETKKTINWEIQVNPGEFETITLKDILGNTMDHPDTVSIYKGNSIKIRDATWQELENGLVLKTDDLGGLSRFFLRYTTDVKTTTTSNKHSNQVETESPKQTSQYTVSEEVTEPEATKELIEAAFCNAEHTRVRLVSEIIVNYNGINDLASNVIRDHFSTFSSQNHMLENAEAQEGIDNIPLHGVSLIRVEDSQGRDVTEDFRFSLGANANSSSSTISSFSQSYPITLSDDTYHFFVQTWYDVDYTKKSDHLDNIASLLAVQDGTGKQFTAEDKWEREVNSGYINKSATKIQEAEVTWCIQTGNLKLETDFGVNEDFSKYSDLVDILPAGLEFVAAAWDTPDVIPEAADNVEPGITKNDDGTTTLTFHAKPNGKLYILTRYADDYAQLNNSASYDNKAYINRRAEDQPDGQVYKMPDVNATATIRPPLIADKTFKYNSETAPFVNYTIKINESALDLKDQEGNSVTKTFEVKDFMGSALLYDEGSLLINGEKSLPEGVTFATNPDGHGFVLSGLQNKTSYVITYRARITLKENSEFTEENSFNKIEIPGIKIPATNKTENRIFGKVLHTYGVGGGETFAFRVHKIDDRSPAQPVKDVEFKLLDYGTGTEPTKEGTPVTLTTGETVETLKTNEAGYTSLITNLYVDHIYGIEETVTPSPWLNEKNGKIIYFVHPHRPKGDETPVVYADNVLNLKDYDTYEFTIENRHLSNCELTLKKMVEGNKNVDEVFHFTVSYKNPLTGQDILEKADIKHGETAKFTVPESSVVTVKELDHPGYTVTMKVSGETYNGDSATFTLIDEKDVEVEISNNPGIELPSTGGAGIHYLYMLGVLLIAGALVYGYSVRRKREGRNV